MSNLKICRICLSDEVKMYKYDCCYLKQFYEEIMCTKINTEDNLPNYFCYECATMLSKFHKFKEKCYTGRLVLQQMLLKGPITLKAIANIDRESCNLKSPLSILVVSKNVKTRYMKSKVRNENIATDTDDVEYITEDNISKMSHESNYHAGDIKCLIEHRIHNDAMDTSKEKLESNYETNSLNNLTHFVFNSLGNFTDVVEKLKDNSDPMKISKVALESKSGSDVNFRELNKEIIQINNNNDHNGIDDYSGGRGGDDDDDDEDEATLVYEIVFDKELNDNRIDDESNIMSETLYEEYIDEESSNNNNYNRMDDSEYNINNDENVIDENVIDENVIDENVIDEKVIDENVIDLNVIDGNVIDGNVIDENVIDENEVDENIDAKNIDDDKFSLLNNSKSKNKKAETGKSKKNTQTKSGRKFEIKKGYNYLDPKHWLKVTLTEEEAFKEFNAKAEDPKYLAATYKCTDCLKTFSKEDMLVRHKKLSHCESLGPQECRFCKRRFKWQCLLNQHIERHYNKYVCLRCDLTCPLEYTAVLHSKSHDGEITKCEHCDKEFRHLSTYYTHLRSHRSEHVCTLCGASFVSAIGLGIHKKIKHVTPHNETTQGEDEYCERCDIRFETKKAYEEHLIHSAKHVDGLDDLEANFLAPSNPKKRRQTLKRHTRIPTDCHICGKHFATQAACRKHHLAEHPRTSFFAPNERHICEVCGISLAPGSVSSHLNIHTREKLYTCKTCGRQFSSKGGMITHQLTHTSEKPVACTLCDKRFKQISSMRLHYRTFHLKEPYPKRNRKKKSDDIKMDEYIHDESDENVALDRWR